MNAGGSAAIVDFVNDQSTGSGKLPGIMTLGYLSAFSETMAKAVIDVNGVSYKSTNMYN